MKYILDLSSHKTVDIEAESPADAVAKAETEYPTYHPDYIVCEEEEFTSYVSHCEICNAPIFDSDDPTTSSYVCANCQEVKP